MDFMLIFGSALLAFGPFLSLFALIVYQKAQLVIVVTSAAFFFLLGSFFASLSYRILDLIGLGGGLAAVLPGVFFQFIARCIFVSIYHKVERVIQISLDKQHQQEVDNLVEQQQQNNGGPGAYASVRRNNNNDNAGGGVLQDSDASIRAGRHGMVEEENKLTWTEAAKLRLQLNDASCGVAAGVGFGGMHAIMLYGTLLASEAGNNEGVLYQSSCPSMPSLAVSGLLCFLFTILDVFWMLFTYFGMRRRLVFRRGERVQQDNYRYTAHQHNSAANPQYGAVGSWLGNSRNGGNVALLLTLGTHFMAAFLTMANYFDNFGCYISLPGVTVVVLLVAYLFWAGVGRIYMPPMQSHLVTERRITPRSASAAPSASRAATATAGNGRRRSNEE